MNSPTPEEIPENTMKLRILRTVGSLFFLLSAVALVHAQALPPAPPEAPSLLSAIVHDLTTGLEHIGGTSPDHRRVASHSPPLPRPRRVELAPTSVALNKQPAEVAPALLVSEKQPLEVAPTMVAPKKKTSVSILIND
jgi:hypothetical protein